MLMVWCGFEGEGNSPWRGGTKGRTLMREIISPAVFEMWKQKELLFIKAEEKKNVLSEHRCKGLKGHRGDF